MLLYILEKVEEKQNRKEQNRTAQFVVSCISYTKKAFSVWTHFLSKAIAQKVLFGIFVRALQLTTLKPLLKSKCLLCSINNRSKQNEKIN